VYSRLDNNTVLYTSSEVDGAINEAARTLNLLTGFYQTRAELDSGKMTELDRKFYSVPSTILVPMRVYMDKFPLHVTTISRLGMTNPDWIGARSKSNVQPMYWARMGLRTFVISPPCHKGGRLLTVSGIGEIPALTADDDVITLNDDLAHLLEDLATHTLPLKVGGAEFWMMQEIYKGFLRRAKELRKWVSYRNPRFFTDVQEDRVPS